MTLKEMKIKTFSIIEEYYPDLKNLAEDEDVLNKINGVINQIQLDLMKYRKIPAYIEISINANDEKTINLTDYIDNLYQVNKIKLNNYEMIDDNILILPDDYEGTFTVYYYKYPKQITFETVGDEFKFDLSTDVLEIMPYGVAGDLLKSDISANYGREYSNRYEQLKQQLDPRYHTRSISFEGGDNYEFL